MAKNKSKQPNEDKPLTKEEVAQFVPEDQAKKLQHVMGFDLSSAYKVGLEVNSSNPAVVAKTVNKEGTAANVDKLPETK